MPTAAALREGGITAEATTNGEGPTGIVPYTRGFNASLGSTSQHDSSNGWSSILTPDLAFRFSSVFSVDAAIPIYAYINVEANRGTRAKPIYQLVTRKFTPGDTSLAAHADTHFLVDYDGTATIGLPTGNKAYGLGAGQPTYFINNHFEHNIGHFFPDVELGIGDTSSLTNRRVPRSYTAVGTIAHFQAGTSSELPHNLSFSADAYEELPIVRGIIYSTTGRGKKKVTTSTAAPSAEDNGFITSLDIPLNRHITLSGLYNRSLRAHNDVAGFSLTFLLRPPPQLSGLPD